MARKLSLDDLRVQSFVTALDDKEARMLVGGTNPDTDCCTLVGCFSIHSMCCDTQDSSCYTGDTDPDPGCGTGC